MKITYHSKVAYVSPEIAIKTLSAISIATVSNGQDANAGEWDIDEGGE